MLNGHRTKSTPQNANITFHYVEGESITLHLDMREIEVCTGSACFSRTLEASHVIMGIGGNHERAHGSIRVHLEPVQRHGGGAGSVSGSLSGDHSQPEKDQSLEAQVTVKK